MDINEITDVLKNVLGRVEAVGETLGIDLLGMAESMARELKDMGYDLVRAAETGQAQ